MIPTRLTIGAASLVLLSALSANADPAYVASTVNLRAGAGTGNEIVAKIPRRQPGRGHQLRRLVRGRVAGQEGLCDRNRDRPQRTGAGAAHGGAAGPAASRACS